MATRRTTRRRRRPTSRPLRSNARPIKIDEAIVGPLMDRIVEALAQFRERVASLKPVWTKKDFLKKSGTLISKIGVVKISDVRGKARLVGVNLVVGSPRSPETRGLFKQRELAQQTFNEISSQIEPGPYRDGYTEMLRKYLLEEFDRDGLDGVVEIYAHPTVSERGDYSWNSVDSAKSLWQIGQTLQHEMLHARDVFRGDRVRSAAAYPESKPRGRDPIREWKKKKSSWEAYAAYYNSPSELRALMLNVLNEVRQPMQLAMGRASLSGKVVSRDASKALFGALAQSGTWAEMEPYLGRESRNLLLKGIVTALEDEGIITIE